MPQKPESRRARTGEPQADRKSRRESRHVAAKDESGWEASSPARTWTGTPALQGRRSKGPGRKPGRGAVGSAPPESQAGEDPARLPSTPPGGFGECPAFLPSYPNGPWHPWDRKMKSERLFLNTFVKTIRTSRKAKIKSFGRKVEKHTKKHDSLLPRPEHEPPARGFPTPGPSVRLSVGRSLSLPPSPAWAFAGGSTRLLSTVQEAHVVKSQEVSQEPSRAGPQFPHM